VDEKRFDQRKSFGTAVAMDHRPGWTNEVKRHTLKTATSEMFLGGILPTIAGSP
jgi:hypothetical protein